MIRSIVAVFLAVLSFGAFAAGSDGVKVVYHMNEPADHATQVIRNIRNHLNADPKVKIVLVAHASGIDFLMRDKKDKNGNPFEVGVQELMQRGVEFRVCEFTLKSRNIDKSQMIDDLKYVPSGVAEVARLQAQEGYAYLKP
jgi:intracellular sulfur oxidation DsrE/DsrF family protein